MERPPMRAGGNRTMSVYGRRPRVVKQVFTYRTTARSAGSSFAALDDAVAALEGVGRPARLQIVEALDAVMLLQGGLVARLQCLLEEHRERLRVAQTAQVIDQRHALRVEGANQARGGV